MHKGDLIKLVSGSREDVIGESDMKVKPEVWSQWARRWEVGNGERVQDRWKSLYLRALLKHTVAGEEIKEGMAIIRILVILGKSIVKISCWKNLHQTSLAKNADYRDLLMTS